MFGEFGGRQWNEVVAFVDRHAPNRTPLDDKSERILDNLLYVGRETYVLPDVMPVQNAVFIYRMVQAALAAQDDDATKDSLRKMSL
jgi:hypothetical protein